MIRSGQFKNKAGKGRVGLSSSVQRAFQRWLNTASVGKLLSASIGNDPSLRDILRMARPTPKDNARRAMFGWLTGKEVEKWAPAGGDDLPVEVQSLIAYRNSESEEAQALVAGGLDNVRWDLLSDAAKGPKVWAALARKMGPQALRMNLNTLLRHDVLATSAMVDYVADRIADESEIRRSKQFPYQYFAAYLNADDNVPQKIKTALHKAAEIACGNVPELPGLVVIGLDTSGSMSCAVTGIEAGEVDCVIVYKVDRLSRSLFDFAQTMKAFDASGVSFVSVIQQFNTTNSMGRLTLNILLSFAQFEREIISERINDKIAAQRQKGLWCGGQQVLGYDVDRSSTSPKLVVNAQEAEMVREIFESYLSLQSLLPVVQKLDQLGWTNKTWLTRKGRYKGGRPFDKCSLHALLTNVIYAGKIRHKDQIYDGQHEPIIDQSVFDKVKTKLKEHGRGNGNRLVNRHNALLKGLLHCPACGYAMVHCPTKKKSKVYRYYVCQTAIKRGHNQCRTGSIPAPAIEAAVVESLRCIVDDEGVR